MNIPGRVTFGGVDLTDFVRDWRLNQGSGDAGCR